MGNNFTITVVAENNKIGTENINLAVAEIKRIEQLFTTFKPDSQTNLINDNAGIANSNINMGYCYFKKGDTNKALSNINSGLAVAKASGLLQWQKNAYQYLSEKCLRMGNHHGFVAYRWGGGSSSINWEHWLSYYKSGRCE